MLIDRNMVGGSSSGRSAGFLTPDSELELHQLVRRFGPDAAREIWEMPCRGIDRIVQSIKKNNIECGLLQQDSLFLGIGKGAKRPSLLNGNAGRAWDSRISRFTTRTN